MQKIVICASLDDTTAASAVKVKNTLDQHAKKYFDSFEIVQNSIGETIIECKIKDTVAFQIVYNSTDSGNTILRAAGADIRANTTSLRIGIYNVYILENAIAFEYGYFNGSYYLYPEALFFMCKRFDGKTAIVYATANSTSANYVYRMANPGSAGYVVVSIDRSTGSATIGTSPHYRNAGTSDVAAYNPFSIVDGMALKNIYFCERTGFSYNYNNNVPFEYTLNGETFTAFRANCIAVKGT